MLFKEDWDKCTERFDAFWEGEIIDRCLTSVVSRRSKPVAVKTENITASSLEEKWFNCDYRYNQAIKDFAATYYGGEAFPNFVANLGPGVAAAYMGAEYALHEDTVWFEIDKTQNSWDNLLNLKHDENSEMWLRTNELLDYFLERANGNFMVCNTDLGGTLDIAASLRGTEQLLMDLYDYPEEVKMLINKIDEIWLSCYNSLQNKINKYQHGSTDWYPTWCRGKKTYSIQCDFSAMISPPQFEEFVKPSLIRQSEIMDRTIYHLDGPGEIPHLDHILDIDAIDGIQWCPGDGQPGGCDEIWYPMYQKIQEKGKKLIVLYADNNKVEQLFENISPKGVFLQTRCETENEANEFLKKLARN